MCLFTALGVENCIRLFPTQKMELDIWLVTI